MSDTRRFPEIQPVERRTFLRYGLVGGVSAGLGVFGVSVLGYLWPTLGEGFGATVGVGNAEDILTEIRDNKAPFIYPSARTYVIEYDPSRPGAKDAYGDIGVITDSGAGLMALYWKCVHLGCRVPWCQSSQWLECPCHGSKYNRLGEWTGGPAPRGLDRFPATIDNGILTVATGTIVTGPSRTSNILDQEPEGPHCVNL